MGVFGFGNVGGAVGEDGLAGFPSSRLAALYKLDELDGCVYKDATGNLPDIRPATGIALDCATTTQYIVDATGLRGDLNGLTAATGVGLSFITPSLGTGTTQYLLHGAETASASAASHQLSITQSSSFGGAGDRYAITLRLRVQIDGAASANQDFALISTSNSLGLLPETAYQLVVVSTVTIGAALTARIRIRAVDGGEWAEYTATSSTGTVVNTSAVLFEGASSVYRVGCYAAGSSPFKGRLQAVFVANGVFALDDLQAVLLNPTELDAQATLGENARFWYFCDGAGSTARELVTAVTATITGGPMWATGLTGCQQSGMGQGYGPDGKWGLVLGGESGFTAAGLQAVTVNAGKDILSSPSGWSIVATFRVGDNLPAAERNIVALDGPLKSGSEAATLALTPGVLMSYSATGAVIQRRKNSSIADGSNGTQDVLGGGARYPSNGEFTTYAITCSTSGVYTAKRIGISEASVTTAYTSAASAANLLMRAARVRIGDPALDCLICVASIAIYREALTDANITQIRNANRARILGIPLWVDDAATAGNGTSLFPFATLHSALRVHQPGGTIYLNGGSANSRIDTTYAGTSLLRPASIAGMELIGVGDPVIVSTLGDTNRPPMLLGTSTTGRWIFRGITFDATDAGVNHAPGYTDGRCSSAAQATSTGIELFEMHDCTVKNAAKADESSGTGLTVRAKDVRVYNLTCTDNEEHGMYARINADSEAVTHNLVVDGFVCTGSGEDGLKVTNEFSDGGTSGGGGVDGTRPAVYFTVDINDVHVVGGKNQLNLLGIASGYVTNCLLEGATTAPLLNTGGILIGSDAYTGYESVSNVLFANITVRNYNTGTYGKAVNNVNSTGCTAYNIITEGCLLDLNDPDGTLASYYCSGNCGDEDGLWPEGNSNQPDATITFAGAGPGTADAALDPASDGYEDGANLWTTATNLRTNLAGAARSEAGAWNRGAI